MQTRHELQLNGTPSAFILLPQLATPNKNPKPQYFSQSRRSHSSASGSCPSEYSALNPKQSALVQRILSTKVEEEGANTKLCTGKLSGPSRLFSGFQGIKRPIGRVATRTKKAMRSPPRSYAGSPPQNVETINAGDYRIKSAYKKSHSEYRMKNGHLSALILPLNSDSCHEESVDICEEQFESEDFVDPKMELIQARPKQVSAGVQHRVDVDTAGRKTRGAFWVINNVTTAHTNGSDKIQEEEDQKTQQYFFQINSEYLIFKPYNNPLNHAPCYPPNRGLYYKFNITEVRLIKYTLEENGFREGDSSNKPWTLMWSTTSLRSNVYQSLTKHQKVNHFPRSQEITRKDSLYKNLIRMQSLFGKRHFDFFPVTYVLPGEHDLLMDQLDLGYGHGQWWIVKPSCSSQGKGIFVTDNLNDIPMKQNLTVSHYINNPMLINGYKFDLRIYVAITSIHPLRIYLFDQGLVRFATCKYSSSDQSNKCNRYMHLTNYSVNKTSSGFVKNSDAGQDGAGSKWGLPAFRKYCKEHNIDYSQLEEGIEDIIIKTLISVEPYMNNGCEMYLQQQTSCFELLGFDILIDNNLKPWLLEVNLSPSMNCDSPLDLKIKGELIANLFNLAGFLNKGGINGRTTQNKKKRAPSLLHELNSHKKPSWGKNITGSEWIGGRGTLSTAISGGRNTGKSGHATTSAKKPPYIAIGHTHHKYVGQQNRYTPAQTKIIKETLAEQTRRIFPSPKWGYYKLFFEENRPLNAFLSQYLFGNRRFISTRQKKLK